jgi:hypothetical protein
MAISHMAWAEPGYRWQMNMEMNGMAMPGMGGGTAQCLPAGRSETPGMDSKECTLLESSRKGNTYHWKARCQGTVSTGDFTYLGETAYKGTVTMEEGGEKMVMKMSGKRLDKCDYSPPRFVAPAMPDMTEACDQVVKDLEPSLVFVQGALCANRKKDFCARLNNLSPESYGRVADRVKAEARQAPMKGYARMEDALKSCGQRLADLSDSQCRRAAAAKDCDFIDRYCPSQQAQCAAGRAFSGRAYTAAGRSGGGAAADPVGQGLNKLKGLFGF